MENSDRIVVDSIDAVLHRGTPIIALMSAAGTISIDNVLEIGAVVCGDVPGRETPDERVFFSPIGMGITDLCLCSKVYELAASKGIGRRLPLFGTD